MTRHSTILLAVAAVIALLGVGWTALAQGEDRPTSLSTTATIHPAVPAVMHLEINGLRLANLRTSDLRDTGSLPYADGSDDLAISVMWIEHLTRDAWRIETVVPVADLTVYPHLPDLSGLKLDLGAGGDITITTPKPEYLALLAPQNTQEITPDLREPILLAALCATPLAPDDPQTLDLMRGFEDWAVQGMEHRREVYLTLDGGTEPVSRCAEAAE